MTTPTPLLSVAAGVDAAGWGPELARLLGVGAGPIVASAVGEAGGRVRRWWPTQVSHQPGSSTVVQYRVEVERPGRPLATETIVAATGARIPTGAAVIEAGGTRVAAWPWSADPALPGLGRALDPERVVGLLDEFGIAGGRRDLHVRARSYRPSRRAVIEITAPGGSGRWFLKVVPPGRAEALDAIHRSLAAHLPVPESRGWTKEGIVVLPAVPGRPLRDVLRTGDGAVPPPGDIDALLDRLPLSLAAGRPRRDLLSLARHHGRVVAATVPAEAGHVEDLLGRLLRAELAEHPVVPVHGDFYDAQLLVEGGGISGLVDVDTAGAGHRVDDLANLLAHLALLGLLAERPESIERYAAAVLTHADGRFDRTDLRARVAAALIGLATGPFRVLEPSWTEATRRRLDLAGSWLDGTWPEARSTD